MIRDSARSLIDIVDGVLDFASLKAGRLGLHPAPLDLRREVERVGELSRAAAERKGLRLAVRVAQGVPSRVLGDGERLGQVLEGLVGNAVKFTEQGAVLVRVWSPLPPAEGVHRVRFEVSDTGIGVDPGEIERLFRPFEQADASTTRRFGGAGLGLTIAASLVEMMGGRVEVESAPGRGSTFWFELPLREIDAGPASRPAGPATSRPAPPRRPAPPTGLRVLVAEDNRVNQLVAVGLLERAGHSVAVAVDGREAVRLSAEREFDLILMDVQMPALDGLGATAAIREREARTGARRVPILAVTAHASSRDAARCIEAGMDGHLAKPIEGPALLQAVHALTAGAQGSGPASAPPPSRASDGIMLDGELLREAAALYLESYPRDVADLRAGLAERDAKKLALAAHRIVGSAGMLGGGSIVTLARPLADSPDRLLDDVDDRVARLLASLARLSARLESVVAS